MSATRPVPFLQRLARAVLPGDFFPRPGLAPDQRPTHWAKPLAVPGLPNLHLVAPGLYRSAQPDRQGFQGAAELGIRRVINLRQTSRDGCRTRNPDLTLTRFPMKARHVAEADGARIVAVLRALRTAEAPVLIHCHHGADRTGVICALYRMVFQGWPREEAIAEMTLGGFGYHPVWANILRYLARVDIEALRERIET